MFIRTFLAGFGLGFVYLNNVLQDFFALYPKNFLEFVRSSSETIFYNEFGRKATDLMYKDFDSGLLVCFTSPPLLRGSFTNLAGKPNPFGTVSYEVNTDYISAELAASTKPSFVISAHMSNAAVPFLSTGLKGLLEIELPDNKSSKISGEYSHHRGSATVGTGLLGNTEFTFSGVIGNYYLGAMGVETAFNIETNSFSKVNCGFNGVWGNISASTTSEEFGDVIKTSYHYLGEKNTYGLELKTRFSDRTLELLGGLSHRLDPATTVKICASSSGVVKASLKHRFNSKSHVRVSGQHLSGEHPSFGVAFEF